MTMPPVWDALSIRHAVEKRGLSLAAIARKHGLHVAACRSALRLRHVAGERAIAAELGVSLWELWPDRWRPPLKTGLEPIRIDNRALRHHPEDYK